MLSNDCLLHRLFLYFFLAQRAVGRLGSSPLHDSLHPSSLVNHYMFYCHTGNWGHGSSSESDTLLPYFLACYVLLCTHQTECLEEASSLCTFASFRVAAEWVLRCGGGVKFKNPEKWIWDYNAIPDGPKGRLALEAINAKGISVTTGGLQHLGNYMFQFRLAFIC